MKSPDHIETGLKNFSNSELGKNNAKSEDHITLGENLNSIARTDEVEQTRVETDKCYFGKGRRKRSYAWAKLIPGGSGKITVNKKPLNVYFHINLVRQKLLFPLLITRHTSDVDIEIKIVGGGITGN